METSLLYTAPPQEAFGPAVAIYFCLIGLSAGAFLVSTLGTVFGFGKFKSLSTVGAALSVALFMAAPLFLLLHIGRPLRAWHLFFYLNGSSPMTWGSLLLVLYPVNCVVYWFYNYRANGSLAKFFGAVGVPLALMINSYSGFILGFAKAHALWRSPVMPVLFLASSLASGVALMMLAAILRDKFWPAGKDSGGEAAALGNILLWLLVFNLFLSMSDVAVRYFGESENHEAARLFLFGAFAPLFLGVEVLAGKLLPLALVSARPIRSAPVLGLVALLVIIGIFTMHYNIVMGGERISLL